MKTLILICLWSIPLISWGEELLLEATKQKFKVEKLEGLQVNGECLKAREACLAMLAKAPAPIPKGPENTVGHPASKYCHAKGGASVILIDVKHNQYDYCLFQNKYLVDSWDLYRKYNK